MPHDEEAPGNLSFIKHCTKHPLSPHLLLCHAMKRLGVIHYFIKASLTIPPTTQNNKCRFIFNFKLKLKNEGVMLLKSKKA
jgi:hypothetical protein